MKNRITNRRVFERYLTHAEEKKLFAAVARFAGVYARRDHAWMTLMRQTGIRVGAMAGLTVGDARQALRTHYLVLDDDHAKGGWGYSVYVGKKARKSLQALLRIRKAMGHGLIPDEPLVVSRHGQGLSVRSFQARMALWRDEAGLDVEASPHWFRHTLAKRILSESTARNPVRIVQLALGHRDDRSTAVYTLPDREDVELAMEEAS